MRALTQALLLTVAIVAAAPSTASALGRAQPENRVWGQTDLGHVSVCAQAGVTQRMHWGNREVNAATASECLLAPRVTQVAKAIDPNKLHHIFGQAKHNLGPLVEKLGSQEAAFRAVESATQTAVRAQGLSGVYRTTVQVGGHVVGVEGIVIEDVARIGSFWIP